MIYQLFAIGGVHTIHVNHY